jgi:hypothetical protein
MTGSPFLRRVLYRLVFGPWRIGSQGHFQARVNNAEPEAQVFKHMDQWYPTMGDGDLEMAF